MALSDDKAVISFWGHVARRALVESWSDVIQFTKTTLVLSALVSAVAAGYWWTVSGMTGVQDAFLAAAVVIGANVTVFLALFVARLFTTPWRVAKDLGWNAGSHHLTLFFDPEHPVCIQRVAYSASEVVIIRVGIVNVSNRRRQRVSVVYHDIQPPLPSVDYVAEDDGVKSFLSTGHLHHACPLKDTSPTIRQDVARVTEFEVDPSPQGLPRSPTAFVDVIWQAEGEDRQFHARLLCCPAEVTHHLPEVISTRLPATKTELVLRLSTEESAPNLRLQLLPGSRGEFVVTAL